MQGSSERDFIEPGFGSGDGKNPTVVADIAASFTYASYQNAIPVLREIRIENADGRHHENIRVDLISSPSFPRHVIEPPELVGAGPREMRSGSESDIRSPYDYVRNGEGNRNSHTTLPIMTPPCGAVVRFSL